MLVRLPRRTGWASSCTAGLGWARLGWMDFGDQMAGQDQARRRRARGMVWVCLVLRGGGREVNSIHRCCVLGRVPR